MAHTENKYFYETVYDQECEFYGCNKHNLTTEQYYDKYNTKVYVGEGIGITKQHRVVMEYTAQ